MNHKAILTLFGATNLSMNKYVWPHFQILLRATKISGLGLRELAVGLCREDKVRKRNSRVSVKGLSKIS